LQLRDVDSEGTSNFESVNTSPERPLKKQRTPPAKKHPSESEIKNSLVKELVQSFPTYDEFCLETKQTLSQASNGILFNTLSLLENDRGKFSKGNFDKIMSCFAIMQKYIMIAESEITKSRKDKEHFDKRDFNSQTFPNLQTRSKQLLPESLSSPQRYPYREAIKKHSF